MKIAFGIIVYLLAIVGLFTVGSTLYLNFIFDPADFESKAYESADSWINTSSNRFSEYIYFDSEVQNLGADLPVPPIGDAELSGYFFKDGNPVAGIELSVILNGTYKKEGLVTDDDGRFSLALIQGDWRVNGIITEGWKNKPEGDFMVVSGSEGKINSSLFHHFADKAKKHLTLTNTDSASMGIFVITEVIDITQPAGSEEVIVKEPSQFKLEWNSHPKAFSYTVDIQGVSRQGSSSSYSSVYKTTTDQLTFSLRELKLISDENEVFNEYAVNIKGYDENGSFVSESRRSYDSIFKLQGWQIPDSSKIMVRGTELNELASASHFADRIDAIRVLLDEDMISGAEQLLGTIDQSLVDWRLDRIQGYLAAKNGRCAVANKYFDLAKSKSGFNCIPSKYKAACD